MSQRQTVGIVTIRAGAVECASASHRNRHYQGWGLDKASASHLESSRPGRTLESVCSSQPLRSSRTLKPGRIFSNGKKRAGKVRKGGGILDDQGWGIGKEPAPASWNRHDQAVRSSQFGQASLYAQAARSSQVALEAASRGHRTVANCRKERQSLEAASRGDEAVENCCKE